MANSRKFLYMLEERVVEYYKELKTSKIGQIILSTVPTIPAESVGDPSLILFGCVLFLGTMGMIARVLRGRHGTIRRAANLQDPHQQATPFPTSQQYQEVGVRITEFSHQITSDELSENTRRAMELTQSVVTVDRPRIPDTFKSVVRKRTPALDSVPVDEIQPAEDALESSFLGEVGSTTREMVSNMKTTEWIFEKGSLAWDYVTSF
jgi:hypothetical protein